MPTDPNALSALHQRCFTMPRPWSKDEFTTLLADPMVHLIELPGGFGMVRVVLDEAELLTICVDPTARRSGIGRAVLDGLHRIAHQAGASAMFLEVAETNLAACALYARAGYKTVGFRPNYYRNPPAASVRALVMRCELEKI